MIDVVLNSNPKILIASLVLISISILGMLITLFWFAIYKWTLDYTYKNFKALETIDYTPLLKWILNIHSISSKDKGNTYLAITFDIFFKNYYEMYGERFAILCKQTALFLDSNSSRSWPMISNFIRAKELNKKIEMLRVDARDNVANIQNILELQTITRNWFVKINKHANAIMDLIKEKNQKSNPTTIEIWRPQVLSQNFIKNVESHIEITKQALLSSRYENAVEELKEVSSKLGEIVQLIDNTDKINNLIDNQLRMRLQYIIKEIKSINLSPDEKQKNITSFISLQNAYYSFLKATKIDIYSLKIDDAYKKCSTMIEQIKKHESNLKYEMLIKSFVKSNFNQMQNVLNQCNKDILKTLDVIEFNSKLGKKMVSQRQKVDDVSKSFANLRAKAIISFKDHQDSKIKEYAVSHKKRGQEIKDIYEKARVILDQLSAIRGSMRSQEHYKIGLESKIISFKKMLLATELIIAKNPNIPELNKYRPQIQKHFDRLKEYENILKSDPEVMKTKNSIDEFSDYLDQSNSEIAKLKTEIAQNVYIAKLAEMSLSYVARFGGIGSLDIEIEKSISDFEKSKYKECLNRNITFLKEIKSNNKGAVA